MNKYNIAIIKAGGEKEFFSEEKLRRSIKRAGIPNRLQNKVVNHIKDRLYPNIPTSEIYKHIIEFLDYSYPFGASKYSLKRAIMDLGPTGYPFEKFIAKLLKHRGYNVDIDVILPGKCVKHEVDVVAIKNNQRFMIECKFHNRPGLRTNVKVALYIKSRFNDLNATYKEKKQRSEKFHQAWLVTNTKCTSNAIKYAECVGMKIVAWRYPKIGSLQDLIEKTGLQPLTCLTTLSSSQKRRLLSQNIVLCRDLFKIEPDLLRSIGLSDKKEKDLRKEIDLVCGAPRAERVAPL